MSTKSGWPTWTLGCAMNLDVRTFPATFQKEGKVEITFDSSESSARGIASAFIIALRATPNVLAVDEEFFRRNQE